MRKTLVFLLGLIAIVLAAKWYLGTTVTPEPEPAESSQARRRLDDVREKRKAIEDDQDKRMREALEKADDAQKR